MRVENIEREDFDKILWHLFSVLGDVTGLEGSPSQEKVKRFFGRNILLFYYL
jgi:hypothetical protein